MNSDIQLNLQKEQAALAKMYEENPATEKLHAIVIGEKGAGKTSLALTCPTPVHIDSFDPGGTDSVREGIKAGKIFVDTRFEKEDSNNPTAYALWEEEFKRRQREGYFHGLGTYILDGSTLFGDCMMNQILKKEKQLRAGMNSKSDRAKQGMQIQDWGTYLDTFAQLARALALMPCHAILMGHIDRDMDEVQRAMIKGLMLPGKSSEKVPIIFPEFYVLQVKEGKHVLLTQNDGEFRATTRLGRGGRLDKYEPADISALLRKVGVSI